MNKDISAKGELSPGDYLRFRELVRERSGLYFPEKRWADLEMGIFKALAESPLAVQRGSHNLDEYYRLLCDKGNPVGRAEMDRLIKMLTIGETHFFRDKAQFDALTTQVLPDLIARKRAVAAAMGPNISPQLRIWSAGCATGEEPYSVAIVLKELLPDLENWQILILATDINADTLARARDGLYSSWSFRETRAKALQPHYFSPETQANQPKAIRYRLHPAIRHMVTFAVLNLIEDDYPAIHNNTMSMDLILCRNVTIYFAEEATQQVIKQFYEVLVEGGWLVVGHSEPSLLIYQAFHLHTFPDTFLYQKNSRLTARLAQWARPDSPKKATGTLPARFQAAVRPAPRSNPPLGSTFGPDPLPSSTPPVTRTRRNPAGPAYESQGASSAKSNPCEQAQLLLQAGRIQDAITELRQKLGLEPNFAPAHSLLGLAYAELGQWDEARQWCQSALKWDNLLAEAYFVLGLVAQHEQDTGTAIDMFKKAVYLDRQAPLFHLHLGLLYHHQGQSQLARRAYTTLVRILEKWPPEQIVPYSGGATAKYLLDTTRRILSE